LVVYTIRGVDFLIPAKKIWKGFLRKRLRETLERVEGNWETLLYCQIAIFCYLVKI